MHVYVYIHTDSLQLLLKEKNDERSTPVFLMLAFDGDGWLLSTVTNTKPL